MYQRLRKFLSRLTYGFSQRRFIARVSLLVLAIVLVGGILIVAPLFFGSHLPFTAARQFSGSKECVSYAQKVEGKTFDGVHTLNCTLSPRKIGNSALAAQYLEFSGAPNDQSACMDPGVQLPPDPESKYCIDFYGVALSDGRIFQGVGSSPLPIQTDDYCHGYNGVASSVTPPPAYDLYFYKGNLYDRRVFANTQIKTRFGTCILNGTRITRPQYNCDNLSCTSVITLTNMTVSYIGMPNACPSPSSEDFFDCVDLVTAATASLSGACYTDNAVNNDCEKVYVERMAELNRCQEVPDTLMKGRPENRTMRDMCKQEVVRPGLGIIRINGAI